MLKRYLLEIIVFITGAVVMMMELVGTRILAPYVGTSIIVWTSLIGIILGALSFGYAKGGELADKRPSHKTFSLIIFLSAINVALVSILREGVLTFVESLSQDLRITSVISAILLFAPPSVLLGMVVPYAVKLKLKSLAKTGRTTGNLYAASTVGSIFGTFFAGFYIIAVLGSGQTLTLLSALLFIASYLAYLSGSKNEVRRSTYLLLAPFIILGVIELQPATPWLADFDTNYNRVILQKGEHPETKRPFIALKTGLAYQSAMYLDQNDELLPEYAKYYRLAGHFRPEIKRSLMIGGAGYSYPKDFLQRNPTAEIDVVEIDPGLTEVARNYFKLEDNPRMTIYHQDGRIFLNNNKKKYDSIYIDAYSDVSIPFHLTTLEVIEFMFNSLNEGGVVILNVLGSIEGASGKFLRAELVTYKEVFPQVYIFPVRNPSDGFQVQNIALVAIKSEKKPFFESEDPEISSYLSHLWTKEVPRDMPVLTDDFAPVDQYTVEVIKVRK